MSNKNKNRHGIVYSTDPEYEYLGPETEDQSSHPKDAQKLIVMLERKGRGGKDVTLIEGYRGPDPEKEELVKKLKTYCGTGGSFKDGEMIVQGDQREKVLRFLLEKGYSKAKRGN